MKVVDLKTMVVENEPPYRGGRYLLFLEIVTDEGISGLGERITGNTYSKNLGDLKSQINLIEEMGREYVIGKDPFRIERIWDRMYASRHDFRHPSLHATPVISAIDMALWDIVGKALEQPISAHDLHATTLHLLGIDHERLTYRFSGRDMRLTDVAGTLIPQIVG